MVKKKIKMKTIEETEAEILKKDLIDLNIICQMARQIIAKNDDPAIISGLELAFTTDLITPNGVKLDELIDEDIILAFFEYSVKVGDKLREGNII